MYFYDALVFKFIEMISGFLMQMPGGLTAAAADVSLIKKVFKIYKSLRKIEQHD